MKKANYCYFIEEDFEIDGGFKQASLGKKCHGRRVLLM